VKRSLIRHVADLTESNSLKLPFERRPGISPLSARSGPCGCDADKRD